MKSIKFLFLLFLFANVSSAQIPIHQLKREIKNLDDEAEIIRYWDNLYSLDQNILLKTNKQSIYDSISVTQMIKVHYLLKYHKKLGFKSSNVVPMLILSHSRIPQASSLFWNIIEEYVSFEGEMSKFGGEFPFYGLEAVSIQHYGYSVLNQIPIYDGLRQNLITISTKKNRFRAQKLRKLFENQKRIYNLKDYEIIGQWHIQPFKNFKERDCFEIIRLSDKNLYLRLNGILQKIITIEETSASVIFQIAETPFKWQFVLKNNNLELINETGESLIKYSLCIE